MWLKNVRASVWPGTLASEECGAGESRNQISPVWGGLLSTEPILLCFIRLHVSVMHSLVGCTQRVYITMTRAEERIGQSGMPAAARWKCSFITCKNSAYYTLYRDPGGGCWFFLLPGGRQDDPGIMCGIYFSRKVRRTWPLLASLGGGVDIVLATPFPPKMRNSWVVRFPKTGADLVQRFEATVNRYPGHPPFPGPGRGKGPTKEQTRPPVFHWVGRMYRQ